MSAKQTSKSPGPVLRDRRLADTRRCVAEGKKELARIENEIAQGERISTALNHDLQTLRSQKALVKMSLNILIEETAAV